MKITLKTFLLVILLIFILVEVNCIQTGASYDELYGTNSSDEDPNSNGASDSYDDEVEDSESYCDVAANLDKDGDGENDIVCGGKDCDDTDASINSSIDADGDGYSLCDDEDTGKAADCDDTNPQVYADLASDSGWVRQCSIVDFETLDECDESDDQNLKMQPTLTKVDDEYVLVYRVCDSGAAQSVAFAYSSDLVTWTESSQNPVFGPKHAGWNDGWTKTGSTGVSQPWLFYDENRDDYVLYFHAKAQEDGLRKIGCATSVDGETYEDDWGDCDADAVILDVGEAGKWDAKTTQGPSVLYSSEDDLYHMFYSGQVDGLWGIGWATSDDAITWTKETIEAPLMSEGSTGTWEDNAIKFPGVIYDTKLEMYWAVYLGERADDESRIGLAYFEEVGDDWTKSAFNPIMETYPGDQATRWDSHDEIGVGNLVMIDENTFLMIYRGEFVPEGEEILDWNLNTIMHIGFAINKRPQIMKVMQNGYSLKLGSEFSLIGFISDDKPETVTVSFTSNLDGEIGTATPDSNGKFSFALSSLSGGAHTIVIRSLDQGGIMDQDSLQVNMK